MQLISSDGEVKRKLLMSSDEAYGFIEILLAQLQSGEAEISLDVAWESEVDVNKTEDLIQVIQKALIKLDAVAGSIDANDDEYHKLWDSIVECRDTLEDEARKIVDF